MRTQVQPDPLAVEVTTPTERMRFDAPLVPIHSGTNPKVGHSRTELPFDLEPASVHARSRPYLADNVQVRGREAQLAATPIASDDASM